MGNGSFKELQEGIIISPEKSISDSLAQVMKLELDGDFSKKVWKVMR